ncbi:MAG: AsnC family protein, partial [Paracoccaceae bacterium]
MTDLTEDGRRTLAEIASRHGLSEGAVEHMARAVARGGGTMAQFNLPELGGSGQWMAGGMTMVGDMFNHGLVARVDALCAELSHAMANQTLFRAVRAPGMAMGQSGGAWWPDGLGQPSSTGGQGATRYAYFPQARRVAVDAGDGRGVVLLDAGDHRIGGFSQQQQGTGGDPLSGVSFSSQHGQFSLASLPRVGTGSRTSEPAAATPAAATETTTASGARTAPEAP